MLYLPYNLFCPSLISSQYTKRPSPLLFHILQIFQRAVMTLFLLMQLVLRFIELILEDINRNIFFLNTFCFLSALLLQHCYPRPPFLFDLYFQLISMLSFESESLNAFLHLSNLLSQLYILLTKLFDLRCSFLLDSLNIFKNDLKLTIRNSLLRIGVVTTLRTLERWFSFLSISRCMSARTLSIDNIFWEFSLGHTLDYLQLITDTLIKLSWALKNKRIDQKEPIFYLETDTIQKINCLKWNMLEMEIVCSWQYMEESDN